VLKFKKALRKQSGGKKLYLFWFLKSCNWNENNQWRLERNYINTIKGGKT